MEIKNLKEFKALVKACRSLGIDAMEVGNIKFNLGPIPKSGTIIPNKDIPTLEESVVVPQYNGHINDPITEPDIPDTEMLTEDQLMFYSAQGHNELEQ